MLSAEEIEHKKEEFYKGFVKILYPGSMYPEIKLFPKQFEMVKERVGPITCAECELNDKCEFAWDFYNTNGDCLAEK